tara:strand:+ start:491 stop:622 length:132 start_codon:yes stop_codon:yes gene_type:complete
MFSNLSFRFLQEYSSDPFLFVLEQLILSTGSAPHGQKEKLGEE